MSRAQRRRTCLVMGALVGMAGAWGVDTALAGSNPSCDLNPGGFFTCVTQGNPSTLVAVHAHHAAATPYRFGVYNQAIAKWQGGPWWRYGTGYTSVFKSSIDPVNWNGLAAAMVSNQGTSLGRFYVSLD